MVDLDSPHWRPVLVPAGTYPVERISNPRNEDGRPWLRLEGTRVGINERLALDMANVHFGDFRLEIRQTTDPDPSSGMAPEHD